MVLKLDNITITPDLLSLITELDSFKASWRFLNQQPEKLKALRTVATIESIGSSTRIEGSKLSDKEVEQLLTHIKNRSFTSRDEEEVAGYAYVCEEIYHNFDAMPFTENTIKQLHQWLLQFSHKDTRHRGHYKKLSNNVEAFDAQGKSLGIVFETSSPFETPRHMEELITWTQEQLEKRMLHPLLVIGVFIVVFLAIHPFQDGNGRLSRLLTTLLLLQSGYAYVPYSSLESFIERSKKSYYLALQRTQKTLRTDKVDFHPWLLFFLLCLQKQKNHLALKIEKTTRVSADLSPLSAEIIALLEEHTRLTMGSLELFTHANRSTLKQHVTALVQQGKIEKHGQGKGTWYSKKIA
jgi:Fic family protein